MKSIEKATAWFCIASTMLLGCYSSELITSPEEGKGDVLSSEFDFLVTKDGKKYEFDVPHIVSDSAIVFGQLVSIPLSDVARFYSGGEGGRIYLNRIEALETRDGEKYEFAMEPKISHDTIVGYAVNKGFVIPRSDVVLVAVTKFSYAKTALLVLGYLGFTVAVGFVLHEVSQ